MKFRVRVENSNFAEHSLSHKQRKKSLSHHLYCVPLYETPPTHTKNYPFARLEKIFYEEKSEGIFLGPSGKCWKDLSGGGEDGSEKLASTAMDLKSCIS